MNYFETGLEILKKINTLGYEAYIVGGAVRDYLLQKEIHDIDITTNMPIEILLHHFDSKEQWIEYGSVKIIIADFSYEITHFRKDIKYRDNRHPEIEFVDTLKEDIIRRDFTINGLAMNSNLEIIDYCDGEKDLIQKRIRCIGDPILRFEEDSLRILRALYFSSKLDFIIEENTLNAIINKKCLLKNLSNERIYDYFIKIVEQSFSRGRNYIERYDLFSDIEEYKKLFSIWKEGYHRKDLPIYYYLAYGTFLPICTNPTKKMCEIAKKLIDSNFSLYDLYTYQKQIKDLFEVLSNLGYDIFGIKEKLSSLKIKEDKELALTKKEISESVEKDKITLAIKEIIKAILEERIDNDRKSILIFLKGLDVVSC